MGSYAGVDVDDNVNAKLLTIDNAGYIYGDVGGIRLFNSNTQIENSGRIEGNYALGLGGNNETVVNDATGVVTGNDGAVASSGTGLHVVNAGLMSSTVADGYVVQLGRANSNLSSSGDIQGVSDAVEITGADDRVENSGTIAVTQSYGIFAEE